MCFLWKRCVKNNWEENWKKIPKNSFFYFHFSNYYLPSASEFGFIFQIPKIPIFTQIPAHLVFKKINWLFFQYSEFSQHSDGLFKKMTFWKSYFISSLLWIRKIICMLQINWWSMTNITCSIGREYYGSARVPKILVAR